MLKGIGSAILFVFIFGITVEAAEVRVFAKKTSKKQAQETTIIKVEDWETEIEDFSIPSFFKEEYDF